MKHKSTINLYNKLSDVVENLAELVEIQELTDTVILQVCSICILVLQGSCGAAFFGHQFLTIPFLSVECSILCHLGHGHS